MDKKDITYFPDNWEDFNGVLIVLREPHSEDGSDAFKGNQQWFREAVLNKDINCNNRLASRYRNRFNEMLAFCGKKDFDDDVSDLKKTAYTNIKKTGGGGKRSEEYVGMENKHAVLEDIIETVKPEYVFTMKEVLDEYIRKYGISVDDENGIKYRKKGNLLTFEHKGIVFFQIYHPCLSGKIIVHK